MRVDAIIGFGNFAMQKKFSKQKPFVQKTVPDDIISFSSSAKYLKKYATLPENIKKLLSPKDAIDMFKDMEMVASGKIKRQKIAQGKSATIYKNPWLKDYDMLVVKDGKMDSQVLYSVKNINDAVWCDKDNPKIQLVLVD